MTVLEPVIEFLIKLKEGKLVSLEQVISGADRPRKPVLRVMDRLVREGNLEEVEDNKVPPKFGEVGRARRNPTWKILEKPILEEFIPQPKRDTLRDKMWRLIRARRRFTRKELVRLSGAGLGSCEDFTKLLVRDGYLRITGKDSRQQVYMLIKDPGPKRPIIPEVKNDAQ